MNNTVNTWRHRHYGIITGTVIGGDDTWVRIRTIRDVTVTLQRDLLSNATPQEARNALLGDLQDAGHE